MVSPARRRNEVRRPVMESPMQAPPKEQRPSRNVPFLKKGAALMEADVPTGIEGTYVDYLAVFRVLTLSSEPPTGLA